MNTNGPESSGTRPGMQETRHTALGTLVLNKDIPVLKQAIGIVNQTESMPHYTMTPSHDQLNYLGKPFKTQTRMIITSTTTGQIGDELWAVTFSTIQFRNRLDREGISQPEQEAQIAEYIRKTIPFVQSVTKGLKAYREEVRGQDRRKKEAEQKKAEQTAQEGKDSRDRAARLQARLARKR